LVSGGYKWADLALGDRFVCGVTVTGAAYCWGGGNGGQLGNGSFGLGVAQRPIPTLVQGGLSFIKISAGGESVCAITTNNSGYCWGVDHRPYGGVQVGGLGTQAPLKTCDKDGLLVFCSPVPALVAGGIAWKQIVPSPGVAGWACGVSTNDDAYCWGTNDYGRLGSGLDITGSQTPTKVAGTYYP
jgi:alpha-tubulin suppressor-like RCC1 family protein